MVTKHQETLGAVSQHFESPQAQMYGLERFLRNLERDATGKRYVTVISGWTDVLRHKTLEDVEAELKEVVGRMAPKHLRRVTILMLPNRVRGRDCHDRFVRFGDYIWDLRVGIRVLSGAFVPERSTASFMSRLEVPSDREAEDQRRRHGEARKAEISV